MKRVFENIKNSSFFTRILEWSKTISLPGFGSLPLYTVCVFFFHEIVRESILNKSASLAYNFILAIFPGIIFLFTLIPYIPIANFQDQLLAFLQVIIPNDAFELIQTTLEDIIKKQNRGLLSFGFLLSTFFATNGMTTLMFAFNKSALAQENRSWGRRRLVALFLSFAIVLAITIGIGAFTAAGIFISYLQKNIVYDIPWFWKLTIKIARWIILFLTYFFSVSFLYKFAPASSKKWKFFSPGATLATLLAILTFSGFAFYINQFGTYNKIYGSIGTIIVIMVWMYLNSLILLIGYELNASIALSKQSIKIIGPKSIDIVNKESDASESETE